MSPRSIQLPEAVHEYVLTTTVRESEALRRIRTETAQRPEARMQTSAEQGQFIRWLLELVGARRCLEIGVYTGYSAMVTAEAIGETGTLVACEQDPTYAEIARSYLQGAGLAERVQFRIGPAAETLAALLDEGGAGSFDFVYVDADKESYDAYFELGLRLVRVGGLLAFDNMLWGGSVADPDNTKPSTVAIRRLNLKVTDDPRVTSSLVPIGDGLMLVRRADGASPDSA
ncbi:MAG: class I SAM-dependent methyltransferase [Myxococcota bacterium]